MAYLESQSQSHSEILDQAIELAGSNTLAGKELLKAKHAILAGTPENDVVIRKALYSAFDKLSPKQKAQLLAPNQKRMIEEQISKLFQNEPQIKPSKLNRVDKLANKSYVRLQEGGSIASYRYLLEALDLAELSLSNELVQGMIHQSESNLNEIQRGGAVGAIIGVSSLALLILVAVIYFWRNRPAREMAGLEAGPAIVARPKRPTGREAGFGYYETGKTLTPEEARKALESVLKRPSEFTSEPSHYGRAPAKAFTEHPSGPVIPPPIAQGHTSILHAPAGVYGNMPHQPTSSQYAVATPMQPPQFAPVGQGIYGAF